MAPFSGIAPAQIPLGRLFTSLALCSGILLTGCGGGGSGSALSSDSDPLSEDVISESGELALALTDAEGDFLTYQVDITAITLSRNDGTEIETLPLSTSVDFAQYVDVSELLTLATVPAGVYNSIVLQLDYQEAEVLVQTEDGSALSAQLLDQAGEPLTELSVAIELQSGSDFTIAPGIPAQVTLDFDLDASNAVTIEGDSATVVVDPVLLADTEFNNPKSMRLRGLLDEVSTEDHAFSLSVRPFRHFSGNFGTVRVHISEDTQFEVDGEVFDADTGLSQLQGLGSEAPVITAGEWNRNERAYLATQVYAGSSVAWADADLLKGVVVARTDNELTVRGGIVELRDGNRLLDDSLTISIADSTMVTVQGSELAEGTLADISVGSKIRAIGERSGDASFDASEGKIRVVRNNVTGQVVSASPLVLDMHRLSGLNAEAFDFTGTGADVGSDADASAYEIDTTTLPLASVDIGDPIKVRGLVSAFGSAPEDFDALSLVDISAIKSHLVVHYGRQGSDTAIAVLTDSQLTLDLTDATGRHHIVSAGVPVDLTSFETMPQLAPGGETGVFALTQRGRVEIFSTFAEFSTALSEALADGQLVTHVNAHGEFDQDTLQLMTTRMRIGLSHQE